MKSLIIAMKQIFQSCDFWLIVAMIVLLLIALFCKGCATPKADLTPETDKAKLEALRIDRILEAIHQSGRLATAFIVVIVVGVFLCKVALSWGLLTIFAGGIGVAAVRIDQIIATNLATNPYLIRNPWWILLPIGMAMAAGGFWFFKNEQVRTALRQIVGGTDKMKTAKAPAYEVFKNYQEQSKPTEKIVREIKAKL